MKRDRRVQDEEDDIKVVILHHATECVWYLCLGHATNRVGNVISIVETLNNSYGSSIRNR